MEINFLMLVIAALAGLIIKAIWGFNPVAAIGGFSLLVLFLPMLGLAVVHDPQALQAMSDAILDRLINALPSLIIGEVAGMFASTIFKAVKELL